MASGTYTGSFESNEELFLENYPAAKKIWGGSIIIMRRKN